MDDALDSNEIAKLLEGVEQRLINIEQRPCQVKPREAFIPLAPSKTQSKPMDEPPIQLRRPTAENYTSCSVCRAYPYISIC